MPIFTQPVHEHGDPNRSAPYPHGKARLSIRAVTYRDKPGFSVTGKDPRGRQVRIFTATRASANQIKAKIARGEDTTVADFEVQDPKPEPPRLRSWGTPVQKIQGDRMADLRSQIQKGELVIGQRYEKRPDAGPYGGVMVTELGRVQRVMKDALDIERPDGTKIRIDAKVATFRRSEELESAEEVWQYYKKYGIPAEKS